MNKRIKIIITTITVCSLAIGSVYFYNYNRSNNTNTPTLNEDYKPSQDKDISKNNKQEEISQGETTQETQGNNDETKTESIENKNNSEKETPQSQNPEPIQRWDVSKPKENNPVENINNKEINNNINNSQASIIHRDETNPTLNLSQNTKNPSHEVMILAVADDNEELDYIELPNNQKVKGKTANYVVSKNGDYSFKAVDKTGNVTLKTINIANIDNIPPTLELSKKDEDITKSTFININCDDANFDYVLLPNGEKVKDKNTKYEVKDNGKYTFKVFDLAGNMSEKTIEINNIDNEAPNIEINYIPNVLTNKEILLNVLAFDENFDYIELPNGEKISDRNYEYKISENGNYIFKVYDKAGNCTERNILIDNIDKETPILFLNQKDKSISKSTNISVEAIDNNFDYILLPNGEKTKDKKLEYNVTKNGKYIFKVVDKVGNSKEEAINVVNIDNQAPALDLIESDKATTNKNITISVNVEDENFDYILLPNNEKVKNKSVKYEVSKNGAYSFEAYDKAGNKTVKEIKINNIDKEKPTLVIKPIDTTIYTSKDIEIKLNASKNTNTKIKKILYFNCEKEAWDVLPIKDNNNSFIATQNGIYKFKAVDELGNESEEKQIEISNIDKEKPILKLDTNNFHELLNVWSKTKEITLNAYDKISGIKGYQVLKNNEWIDLDSNKYKVYENGMYKFRAIDNVGNISEEYSIGIAKIDNKAPSLKIEPVENYYNGKFKITTSDNMSGLKELEILSPYGEWKKISLAGEKTSIKKVDLKESGEYTIFVKDNAGNSYVENLSVTVDDEAPEIKRVTCNPKSYINKADIEVVVDDIKSGVDRVEVFKDNKWIPIERDVKYISYFYLKDVDKNGTYRFRAIDYAGNVSKESTVVVSEIDDKKPIINYSQDIDFATKDKVKVKVSIEEDSEFTVYLYDGRIIENTKSFEFDVYQNGKYKIRVQDKWGNEEEKNIEIKNILRTDSEIADYYIKNFISIDGIATDKDKEFVKKRTDMMKRNFSPDIFKILLKYNYHIKYKPSSDDFDKFLKDTFGVTTEGFGGICSDTFKTIYLTCNTKYGDKPQTSFHEIGHAIDFCYNHEKNGLLSDTEEFKKIYENNEYKTAMADNQGNAPYFCRDTKEFFAQNFAYYYCDFGDFLGISLNPMDLYGEKEKEWFQKQESKKWYFN